MKLSEIPAGSKFNIIGTDLVLTKYYNVINGSSYCLDKEENIVSVFPWTDVEIIKE